MDNDLLEIPPFLDLRIPENLAAWKEGRRNWRPGSPAAKRAEKRKQNFDSQGNRLPDNMDEASWAFLHQLEGEQAAKAKAAQAERDELKAIERNARTQVREEARAAKRAMREAEKQRKAEVKAAKTEARAAKTTKS